MRSLNFRVKLWSFLNALPLRSITFSASSKTYNSGMRSLFLILVLLPVTLGASCFDNDDPVYNLAVGRGDYTGAFRLIAEEIGIPREDQSRFKIIEGFS